MGLHLFIVLNIQWILSNYSCPSTLVPLFSCLFLFLKFLLVGGCPPKLILFLLHFHLFSYLFYFLWNILNFIVQPFNCLVWKSHFFKYQGTYLTYNFFHSILFFPAVCYYFTDLFSNLSVVQIRILKVFGGVVPELSVSFRVLLSPCPLLFFYGFLGLSH